MFPDPAFLFSVSHSSLTLDSVIMDAWSIEMNRSDDRPFATPLLESTPELSQTQSFTVGARSDLAVEPRHWTGGPITECGGFRRPSGGEGPKMAPNFVFPRFRWVLGFLGTLSRSWVTTARKMLLLC